MDFEAQYLNARIADIKAAVAAAEDFEDAARRMLIAAGSWAGDGVRDAFADILAGAMELAALTGRDAVQREVEGDEAFADAQPRGLAFKEQIDFLRQKEPRATAAWNDIIKNDHDRAFIVAGVRDRDLLSDMQSALVRAMEQGQSFDQFRKTFDELVAKYGWTFKQTPAWRARVVFDTNIRTAYMAGRLKQMRDPAVVKMRPYWEYRHGVTRTPKTPRDQHVAWHGLILPHDDKFWDTHFPPNGWLCSCGVRTLSKRDLKRAGKTGPDPTPEPVLKPHLDKKTGQVVEVPQGIDPGFDYMPGDHWQRGLVPSAIEPLPAPSVVTVTRPEPVVDLIDKAKPFTVEELPKGKPAEFYVAAFMREFRAKPTARVLFRDKAGETIPISADLFRSRGGSSKLTKRGRHVYARQMAETLIDPDEIWLGVRKVPNKQLDGTFERVVQRKYIRIDPNTGIAAYFDLSGEGWSATTIFPPQTTSGRPKWDYLDRQRSGLLIYKRGLALKPDGSEDSGDD
ncbi:MAG: head morphogenesis protein [Hyphomicrobiales bacterium]|nr:head morphogenesis protein [Hyphomicrobiales bacterium]